MSLLRVINFDSINSTYTTNSYNTRFIISTPLKNVSKIYLKSVELPIGFYNVRSPYNVFSVNVGGTIYSLTIPEKNYTDIAILLADLNALTFGIANTTFSFTQSTDKITITMTSTINTSFSIIPTVFSKYMLGFANQTSTNKIITGSRLFNLNYDDYLLIFISNISHDSSNNYQGIQSSFKIQLPATNQAINYNCENLSFSQYIKLSNSSEIISSLDIKILDRFGNNIDAKGYDWSLSLGFEFV